MSTDTYLFEVRNGKEKVLLDEPLAHVFHHYVAQLLFTSTKLSNDIHQKWYSWQRR